MRNSKMIKLTHLEGTIQRMWVYLQSCPTVTTLNSGTCPSLLASPTGNLSLFSPTSQPQAITNLLFFFLSVWICLFWTFRTNGIIPCAVLCE